MNWERSRTVYSSFFLTSRIDVDLGAEVRDGVGNEGGEEGEAMGGKSVNKNRKTKRRTFLMQFFCLGRLARFHWVTCKELRYEG